MVMMTVLGSERVLSGGRVLMEVENVVVGGFGGSVVEVVVGGGGSLVVGVVVGGGGLLVEVGGGGVVVGGGVGVGVVEVGGGSVEPLGFPPVPESMVEMAS